MKSRIEKIQLIYKGKKVSGRRLIVVSEIPISIEKAWQELQKSSLLEFVTKGLITFKPIEGKFPEIWEEGMEVKTRMFFYGFLPFGGIHTFFFVTVDRESHELITNEKDNAAKIWNHRIQMQEVEPEKKIRYADEIEIYGGVLTGLITFWANIFYRYRQKRWFLIAENKMKI